LNWAIISAAFAGISIIVFCYQFYKTSLFSKPSFYIDNWSRMGATANLELKILESSQTDYFLDDVYLETDSGAKIHLPHNQNRHRLLVTIQTEDYMFGLKCRLIIQYRLKNNSRYQAKSPEIVLNTKFSECRESENYLNIVSEVTNKIFV
jgi:hypothetical protein